VSEQAESARRQEKDWLEAARDRPRLPDEREPKAERRTLSEAELFAAYSIGVRTAA
jgi:hypothetical protein